MPHDARMPPAPAAERDAHAVRPVRVFLARHAESVLNALGRVQGWADSPLTHVGRAQARELGLAARAAGARFVAAYSADMLRHRQTAEAALAAAGSRLAPVPDARLRELAFGRFEGAANAELWQALAAEHGHADATALRADDELDLLMVLDAVERLSADSGLPVERPHEVRARVLAALDDVADRASVAGGDVLVVSSGITIMLAIDALGADRAAVEGGIGNAALSVLMRADGAWTVERVNDVVIA
jgi:probable phosphoglycerate mutase